MPDRKAKKQVLTLAQVRALRTPLRQRVLEAFERHGPLSVGELGAHMRRVPETLYYHVSALEKAGLLVRSATRATSGPAETVYDRAAESIVFDQADRSRAYTEAAGQMASAALREAERRHIRALGDPDTVFGGPARQKMLYQAQPRLNKAGLKQLNRMLGEIDRFLDEQAQHPPERGGAQEYSVTFVISPIPEEPEA